MMLIVIYSTNFPFHSVYLITFLIVNKGVLTLTFASNSKLECTKLLNTTFTCLDNHNL